MLLVLTQIIFLVGHGQSQSLEANVPSFLGNYGKQTAKDLKVNRFRGGYLVMTKKINKTYAIECHGIDTLQEYVDEFVKHKKVVSVSVTVTEGPSDFLALIVYREKKNG